MAKRPEIVIVSGDAAGKRFTVPDAGLRLGRSSSNDIHIPDEELSRNHCMFEISGENGIKITDLASANGTLVNGKDIGGEPVELSPGDIIEVGGTKVKVVGEALKEFASSVDLGLGAAAARSEPKNTETPAKKRSPISSIPPRSRPRSRR